jgi:predicted NBD/HSP70 family sugar kinase
MNTNAHELRMLGVEDLRETNELKLLHIIRDRQPISRADLVKATGLRAGTVSVIVNRLLRAAAINEGEAAPSSGGRPATYLQINAEKAYVVGIGIGVHQTIYGVSDFNGRILNQRTIRTDSNAELFLDRLANEIANLLASNFQRARFGGVGVSMPGLIDRVDGCLVRAPNLGWRDLPVREILESKLKLPIHVENDANSAALSELWYGPLKVWSAHCILFILIVEGIGTGLILNGEVYIGSRIGMGGFGHISVDPNGPPCSCGNKGCWESVASNSATISRYRSSCPDAKPVDTLAGLIELAHSGDQCAKESLEKTGASIGRGIKGLAQGLAPEIIVIGGQITAAWSLVEPAISAELQSEYFVPGVSKPEVRPASVEQPAFFGAFPVALRTLLHKRKSRHSA